MSKSRSSKGYLFPPATNSTHSSETRKLWLEHAASSFVSKGQANKEIYSRILIELWPEGHGIPGPQVSEQKVREIVNAGRIAVGKTPYVDPFRRMRELQGEEGFKSIMKEGVRYQLQSLEISSKREPRSKPPAKFWTSLLEKYDFRCGHCGLQEPEVRLSADHRVPRSRHGSNDDQNWQPLCEQCNNLKSSACQGCLQNCQVCSWAYPADYKPIQIDDQNKEAIRRNAEKSSEHQSDFVNRILRNYFNRNQ